jgi:hypothetical protein
MSIERWNCRRPSPSWWIPAARKASCHPARTHILLFHDDKSARHPWAPTQPPHATATARRTPRLESSLFFVHRPVGKIDNRPPLGPGQGRQPIRAQQEWNPRFCVFASRRFLLLFTRLVKTWVGWEDREVKATKVVGSRGSFSGWLHSGNLAAHLTGQMCIRIVRMTTVWFLKQMVDSEAILIRHMHRNFWCMYADN